MEHQHNFVYDGLRYRDGERNLPGTSARPRYYAHVYHCTICLEKRAETVETGHTTYDSPLTGSVMGGKEVPLAGNVYRGSW